VGSDTVREDKKTKKNPIFMNVRNAVHYIEGKDAWIQKSIDVVVVVERFFTKIVDVHFGA